MSALTIYVSCLVRKTDLLAFDLFVQNVFFSTQTTYLVQNPRCADTLVFSRDIFPRHFCVSPAPVLTRVHRYTCPTRQFRVDCKTFTGKTLNARDFSRRRDRNWEGGFHIRGAFSVVLHL